MTNNRWLMKIKKRHKGRTVGMVRGNKLGQEARKKRARKRLNKKIKEGRTYLRRNKS